MEQTFNMSVGDLTERSLEEPKTTSKDTDKVIQRYELEDSVSKLEWSLKDAWVFASLSFNGTLVVNTVPSKEKYRILL